MKTALELLQTWGLKEGDKVTDGTREWFVHVRLRCGTYLETSGHPYLRIPEPVLQYIVIPGLKEVERQTQVYRYAVGWAGMEASMSEGYYTGDAGARQAMPQATWIERIDNSMKRVPESCIKNGKLKS